MAELAKKLYIKKGTTQQTAKIYSTTTEAGNAYVHLIVDGVHVYMPLGGTTDSRATIGRVKETSGTQFAILSSGKPPYHKDSYTSPGTYTWTCPAGVTTARVTVAGGGGGGAVYSFIKISGGSGALITQSVSVSPSTTYTVVVGAGGAIGPSQGHSASDGGTSSALGVSARGGGGATKNGGTSYGSGGAGGSDGMVNGSPGWVYIEYGGDI